MSDNGGLLETPLKRRDFVKKSALLGTGALATIQAPWLLDVLDGSPRREIKPNVEYALAKPENMIYSVCQQCNTQCGIKIKLPDGVAVKVEGSPLSPWNLQPHLPYESSPFDLATGDGSICH